MILAYRHVIGLTKGDALLGFRAGTLIDGVTLCEPCFCVLRAGARQRPVLIAHLRAWLGEAIWTRHLDDAAAALTALHGSPHVVQYPSASGAVVTIH